MNEYRTGHIASWLGQHDNTIRDWSRRFAEHLSEGANAGRRRFLDDDVRILATVANYRKDGISLDAIERLLSKGERIAPDDMPPEPSPGDDEARESVDIVHIPKERYLLEVERYELRIETLNDEIERLQSTLDRLESDRNSERQQYQAQVDSLQAQVTELTGQYEAAKAKVDIITEERRPASYWLAIIAAVTVTVLIIAIVLGVLLSGGTG